MKFLLLFMFVAVAVSVEDETRPNNLQHMSEGFTRLFQITTAESLECIHKSQVTLEDLRYMEDSIDKPDSQITDKESLRRATCTLTCCAQKQGTMVGAQIKLDEIFNYFRKLGVPQDVDVALRETARVCKEQVQNTSTDECMIAYKFIKCMYEKMQVVG